MLTTLTAAVTALFSNCGADEEPAWQRGPEGEAAPEIDIELVPGVETTAACGAGVAAVLNEAGHATIQQALDAAVDGEVVWVCQGTHSELLDISGARSLMLASVSGQHADTLLDGGSTQPMIQLQDGADLIVRDLGFENGMATAQLGSFNGGAIASYESSLHVRGCSFVGNHARYAGGAIAINGDDVGSLVVDDCRFLDNVSEYEGGAIVAKSLVFVEITGCSFQDNYAFYGGGAAEFGYWPGADVTVADSDFSGNWTRYEAGALNLQVAGGELGTMVVEGCSFTNNYAEYDGGAITAGGGGHVVLEILRSSFAGNQSGYEGGAIAMGSSDHGELYVTDASFEGNESLGGGAIDVGGWAELNEVVLQGCAFSGNRASDGGSALAVGSCTQQVDLLFSDSSFSANTGGDAAAYLGDKASLECVRCDWGGPSNDNDPADLRIAEETLADLGSNESFSCVQGSSCVF